MWLYTTSGKPVEDTFSNSTDHRTDYTVLSLNQRVKELLETAFPYPVWLRGEISGNPRVTGRGHMYFQLVDPSVEGGFPEASIDCALFAGSKAQVVRDLAREGISFNPVEGMSVRVLGRVDLWARGGRYQFNVIKVDPAWTTGKRALALRKLLDRLRREGLLEKNPSLELSSLPLRVGLVTSRDSAAAKDFLKTLDESDLPFEVFASWASMQGRDAADTVRASLRALATIDPPLDVVVLTRGGGSQADLDWLNDELIGTAVAACPRPVVSAIGHEIDSTLPDYAAHTCAKTPTHAASLLVDHVGGFLTDVESLASLLQSICLPRLAGASSSLKATAERLRELTEIGIRTDLAGLDGLLHRLGDSVAGEIRGMEKRVDTEVERLAYLVPAGRMDMERQRLHSLGERLESALRQRISEQRLLTERLESEVRRRSPEDMLALGWSVVRRSDGTLVRSVSGIGEGDRLDVTVSDGSVSTRVENVSEEKAGEVE
ncbi:exodeoxyribonuclease VII large subunit [Candidatus Fermentibacteria bacterium]|nr:exodeoxyribonuclease VII large subunit [Candidatus Fermentibacteria bacterium]